MSEPPQISAAARVLFGGGKVHIQRREHRVIPVSYTHLIEPTFVHAHKRRQLPTLGS